MSNMEPHYRSADYRPLSVHIPLQVSMATNGERMVVYTVCWASDGDPAIRVSCLPVGGGTPSYITPSEPGCVWNADQAAFDALRSLVIGAIGSGVTASMGWATPSLPYARGQLANYAGVPVLQSWLLRRNPPISEVAVVSRGGGGGYHVERQLFSGSATTESSLPCDAGEWAILRRSLDRVATESGEIAWSPQSALSTWGDDDLCERVLGARPGAARVSPRVSARVMAAGTGDGCLAF